MKRARFPIALLMAAVAAVAINLAVMASSSDSTAAISIRSSTLLSASCRWRAC